MRKLWLLTAAICLANFIMAQDEPGREKNEELTDTIKLGNVTIIKSHKRKGEDSVAIRSVKIKRRKSENIKTSWFVPDIGLTNYTDNTDYTSPAAGAFAPGATKDWFKLRPVKSVNVNIWIFMQRINMVKQVLNLKYGLGVELNNYRYKEPVRFQKTPTLVYMDAANYRKTKLAADYITIPFMLNVNFTPKESGDKSYGLSLGASAGYLYSSRNKYVSDATGKDKLRDDFDLRPFKLSYIAELKLGFVKLYGSIASRSMFEKGLDQTPYTMGFRLSPY
ncbi:MAG TPA: outer membrane beta-barrel protein [Flavitalea sp.]|nr:outer membrane beta-barrel protein [Flavitalea sp.]